MYENKKVVDNIKKGHLVTPITNVTTASTTNIIPILISFPEIYFIRYSPLFKIGNLVAHFSTNTKQLANIPLLFFECNLRLKVIKSQFSIVYVFAFFDFCQMMCSLAFGKPEPNSVFICAISESDTIIIT